MSMTAAADRPQWRCLRRRLAWRSVTVLCLLAGRPVTSGVTSAAEQSAGWQPEHEIVIDGATVVTMDDDHWCSSVATRWAATSS